MSNKPGDIPVTPAIRVLRESGAAFELATYSYLDHGGTANAAGQLGAPEHAVIKTLVLETDAKTPLICLMHGDCEISTKQLARALGVKQVAPCAPDVATRHTGYLIGGTSPFGTRKPLPVYAEATIFDLPEIWINAGRRGVLARMSPDVLETLIKPVRVTVARDPASGAAS
jgi:Cys-tRNA(Pro) deacylase